MRFVAVSLLLLVFPPAVRAGTPVLPAANPAVEENGSTLVTDGFLRGAADAENRSMTGWELFGFSSGCAAGPCGIFTSAVFADLEPSVPRIESAQAIDFVNGYRLGYRQRLVERRKKAAVRSAIWGTAVLGAVVFLSSFASCQSAGADPHHEGCAMLPGTAQFENKVMGY